LSHLIDRLLTGLSSLIVDVTVAGCLAFEFLPSGSSLLTIMNGVHYLALTCEPWEPRWNHLSLAGESSFTAPLSRGVRPEEKNWRTF
jgi:hypothetical protein